MALSRTGLSSGPRRLPGEEPDDWESVSSSVKRRVARRVTRAAVVWSDPTDHRPGRARVADLRRVRVVRSRLREVLGASPESTPERIDLTIVEDERLVRVEIDLVCAYVTQLPFHVEDVRLRVEVFVIDLLVVVTCLLVDVMLIDVVVGRAPHLGRPAGR